MKQWEFLRTYWLDQAAGWIGQVDRPDGNSGGVNHSSLTHILTEGWEPCGGKDNYYLFKRLISERSEP